MVSVARFTIPFVFTVKLPSFFSALVSPAQLSFTFVFVIVNKHDKEA